MQEQLFIAQIGRTVGLYGDLKLHLYTDFPAQFTSGALFESDKGKLEIISYSHTKNIIKFKGFESVDTAKRLTNSKLYTTKEQTEQNCKLQDNEYFWYEIIGLEVYENGTLLGTVSDLDRLPSADYLIVKTNLELKDDKLAKEFLIPYIPRYILLVDKNNKKIIVQDAIDILKAS